MDGEEEIRRTKDTSHSQIFHIVGVVFVVISVTAGFLLSQQSQVTSLLKFLLPVPLVLIALRYSLWSGIVVVVFSTMSISLLAGYRPGVFFLLIIGGSTAILTLCFHQNSSAMTTVSCIVWYYIILEVALVYIQEGVTIESYAQTLMTEIKEQLLRFYKMNNVTWQNLETYSEILARVQSVTFPLLSALKNSIIIYAVTRIILKLWKISATPLGKFENWQVSDYFVWIFVLGGVLYHIKYSRIMGINFILGVVLLYYVAGCAIVMYYLKLKNSTKFLRIFAYVLLFLQVPHIFINLGLLLTGYTERGIFLPLPAIVLVAGVGLSNIWIDFRKRAEQRNK